MARRSAPSRRASCSAQPSFRASPWTGAEFSGTSLDCFTPFSILTGLALVCGYALLGACWLVLKTEEPLQDWARKLGRMAFLGVLIVVVAVSLWTPFLQPQIAERWFGWPHIVILAPVPIVTALIAFLTWRSLRPGGPDGGPFLGAVGLFVMSYLGLAISLFPMIVPYHFTLWEAASSPKTQAFLLVGTLFLLPIILVYSGWSYWVFRGKVRAEVGYH